MPNKLIGTGPNQVSVNSMLGELAFQSKDSIEFNNGTGTLTSLQLKDFATSKNISAVSVFVYDTSLDSDGGAWRYRCQNTSWYNESLNTTDRGNSKVFPAVAIIIADATSNIYIYDATDSTTPLWMSFLNISGTRSAMYGPGNVRSVCMLNGILATGSQATNFWPILVDFVRDEIIGLRVESTGHHIYGTIAERNLGTADSTIWWNGNNRYTSVWWLTSPISSQAVNKVSMKVLPGAPIDPVTNMAIPTIAYATSTGAFILRDSGHVIQLMSSSGEMNDIGFTNTGGLWLSGGGGVGYYYWGFNSVPTFATNTQDWAISDSGASSTIIRRQGSNGNSTLYPSVTTDYGVAIRETAGISTTNKLILVELNKDEPGNSLFSYINNKYNTGWMHGDSRLATLCDTSQGVVSLAAPPASTWSATRGGGVSVNGSTVTISSGATYSWNGGIIAVTTIPGERYYVTVTPTSITTVGGGSWNVGYTANSDGSHSGLIWGSNDVDNTTTMTLNKVSRLEFTAVYTTSYIIIENGLAQAGASIVFSDFTVRRAEFDRSVTNRSVAISGTINKSSVAPGAELVSYSGFSASNYLWQSYNANLDFGTGDFCVNCWTRWNGSSVNFIFQRGTVVNSSEMCMYVNNDGAIVARVYTSSNGFSLAAGTMPPDRWSMLTFLRRGGVIYLYLNGELKGVKANTESNTITSPMYIGLWTNNANYTGQEISLFRMSKSAPTDQQIKQMYNSEKMLFTDNAKCTIFGDSGAPATLAFDPITNLLHVGTDNARSVFQSLCRIDNTTTVSNTALSVVNNLVAEQ